MKWLAALLVALVFVSIPVSAEFITTVPAGTGGSGSGTVTLVDTSCGISGGPITTTGTVTGQKLVNAQAGTAYTVLDSDCGKLVKYSNGSAVAVALPQAGAASQFVAGWYSHHMTTGAGLVTITPTTSTIDGAASITLAANQSIGIISDGTNYFTTRGRVPAGLFTTTGALRGNGSGTITQAACADLSDDAPSCATDTTNANNISSGTLATLRGGTGTSLTYTDGSVIFVAANIFSQSNSQFFWDGANDRLGIGTVQPSSQLTIQANTTSGGVAPIGTMLHVNAADGVQAAITFDAYATNGLLKFRRANTSAATPSALAFNDPIGGFQFFGYGTTGYASTNRGSIQYRAAQAWTDTAQGTKAVITTVPSGGTATINSLTVEDYGTLTANDYFKSTAGFKRVTAQFDKTSSAALSNITGLSSSLRAGLTYQFESILYTTSNSAGGIQAAISGTATATTVIYEAVLFSGATVAAQTRSTALSNPVCAVTAVTAGYCRVTGTITVNAAGTLTVQFAQNASNINASSVLTGSTLMVWEMP